MNKKKMKVFQIIGAEKDTFCGYSLLTALAGYCADTSISLVEFDESDEIKEVPEEEWGAFVIQQEDHDDGASETITLKDFMESVNSPQLICSTAW